jgi:hypothetical protein
MIQIPTEIPSEESGAGLPRTGLRAAPSVGVVHRALREATRNDQALIDRKLLCFKLRRSEDYRIFLSIHLAALSPLYAACRPQDTGDFDQMLHCLQDDLAALGSNSSQPHPPSSSSSVAKGLGIAYVVRASRLWTAVLRRDVGTALPTSYLDLVPALSWPVFLKEVECIADSASDRAEACLVAHSSLHLFAAEFDRSNYVIARPSWSRSLFPT